MIAPWRAVSPAYEVDDLSHFDGLRLIDDIFASGFGRGLRATLALTATADIALRPQR